MFQHDTVDLASFPSSTITSERMTSKLDTAVAPASAGASDIATDKRAPRNEQKAALRYTLSEKALDDAFSDIWANNANAISHCYSSTDALKVDFTRTGKRSFLGMISRLPFWT